MFYALTNNELEILRMKMKSAVFKCLQAGEPDVMEDVYSTIIEIAGERYDRMGYNVWNP